ncbi:MAG: sigma factor [Planctomycetota bacterium]
MTAVSELNTSVDQEAETDCKAAAASAGPPSDAALAQFAGLVQRHQAAVWRCARYPGADRDEADDLVQETFVSVGRSARWLQPGGSGGEDVAHAFQERSEQETTGYLRTAARNQLLMLRRRQKRQVDTVLLEAGALEAAEATWAAATEQRGWGGLLETLGGCVEWLDGRPRQGIELPYREGASRVAIAKQPGMKPDGV